MSRPLLLLATFSAFAGCRVAPSPASSHDELQLRGLEMRVWRRDELVVSLKADELVLKGGTLVGRGVNAHTSRGELSANSLEFDLRTSAAKASGEVKGHLDGWNFSGAQVRFRRDGVVVGDGPFALTRGSSIRHSGQSFEWDPVGAVAVLSHLSSQMERDGQPVTLSADRVDYRETPRTASATGHVVIDADNTPSSVTLRFVPGHEGALVADLRQE